MEVLFRDGLARIGRFSTPHGELETPTVMPVINPNIIVVSPSEMKRIGVRAIITNSYIIRRNAELREKALSSGLHSMLSFDGPIMTDSGTFQSYVYGGVEYDNAGMVEFQKSIGSDIVTILDVFTKPEDPYEQVRRAIEVTRARVDEVDPGDSLLAGPIQGSIYDDLRAYSAKLMSGSKATYLPIGGVVPLLESYRYADLVRIIVNSKVNAPFSRPIHLFGGGHPMFIPMAVLLGVDIFDSASYVKYARDGRLLFPDGTRDASEVLEFPYWSPLRDMQQRDIAAMDKRERLYWFSLHNLHALFSEIREVRIRIEEQTLWEYVQSKAMAHPTLLEAFRTLRSYSRLLERYTEVSKKNSFMYLDTRSLEHPSAVRLSRFLESFVGGDPVFVPRAEYEGNRGAVISRYERSQRPFLVQWMHGWVPMELEDTYPVQQYVGPEARLIPDVGSPLEEEGQRLRDFDLEKVRAIADYQFGKGAGRVLFPDGTEIVKSRATGRIRTISYGGVQVATMRPKDGLFTLTMEGARRLHQGIGGKRLRVFVNRESEAFNRAGYNVFFKFIVDFDPEIVAGNETLVVSEGDDLLAVGKASVSGLEMASYRKGVAVKVHHSAGSHADVSAP
ncbi:tRNA-guanine(15) transglycosylase [Thermogymnomonas acidicola]|uniref:tRNA-guanine(15) transglycosylase n=2 Tax=Thermogymnomonas acidicola TaxID=399579 RepID=A0AA37BQI6_9ARCH|nr:tRNA-guanine(15) transglycosylase [Thermogymnomonas acidicola]